MDRRSEKRKRIIESSDDEEWFPTKEDIEEEIHDFASDFPELSRCNKKTRIEFVTTQKEVERTEPNIVNILSTPLLPEDKAELFQLFEVYANTNNVSMERLEIRRQLLSKIEQAKIKYKQYNRYTPEEHVQFTKEIKALEQYDETQELKYDILKLETSPENKRAIYNEYKRMRNMPFTDDELPKLRNWLKWSLALPHDRLRTIPYKKRELTRFLQRVSKAMDDELYGMQKVKEQILLFLNARIVNPKMKKCSLGLIGPPGVGKTKICQVIADVLDYPMEQIKMGGIRSPEYLKGHQYTYIGAEPGEIVKCLCRMRCKDDDKPVKNGILFFDEYEKISDNKLVSSALLHITDATQNHKFQDNFLSGITIDLSYLWFFYSMNEKPTDDALADRVYYVNIEGYSQLDKFFIVKDYLLRKAHKNMGWKPNSVTLEDEVVTELVDRVSPPTVKGIRALDDAIQMIARKINFLYHHQNKQGKMTSFKTTFNIGKKLTFPFCLGREKLDIFLS